LVPLTASSPLFYSKHQHHSQNNPKKNPQNKEISFSPEIGDATVGSLVGSTSKDSSIQGPGFFSALVAAVTWVEEAGGLRTASLEDKDLTPLRQITCAYGLMGIIVEASLLVRQHTLARTVMALHPCPRTADGSLAASVLLKARKECDNLFVIMHPCRDQIYTEQRWLVEGKTRVPPLITAANLKILGTPKALCFKRGKPLPKLLTPVVSLNRHMKLSTLHRRYGFTNSYSAVTAKESRLDFSYFEFDVSRFEQVVKGCWEFAAEYEKRVNFTPSGFAMYFVERPGDRLAGNYTGAKGVSFMLDPIHHDPACSRWQKFNEAYNHWAVAHGANVSLTQTKGLTVALGGALPQSLARERFVTPFFRAFLVPDEAFFVVGGGGGAFSYARPLGDEHPRRSELLDEAQRLVDEAEAVVGVVGVEATKPPLIPPPPPPPSTPPPDNNNNNNNKGPVSRLFGSLGLFGAAGGLMGVAPARPFSSSASLASSSSAAPSFSSSSLVGEGEGEAVAARPI
jgi:hypothetical protein